MLVLARKQGERLICTTKSGEVIEIFIARIAGNRVNIGIQAPDDVRIDRGEVTQRKPKGGADVR